MLKTHIKFSLAQPVSKKKLVPIYQQRLHISQVSWQGIEPESDGHIQ